ncbi:MAG: phage major capsid protein [Clostridia bacterium]|nr:phage major capsid protein [Clostridia bacterium]
MISSDNAEKVLKTVYLDVVSKQINTTTSPFYNMIEAGSEGVVGKEFMINTRLGISGGIGCATDDGDLPVSGTPIFYNLRAPLINIFGNVEITDKALRATSANALHVVDLLNHEMGSLIEAAKFNFGRMLYQDGKGILCKIVGSSSTQSAGGSVLYVDSVKNVVEGMLVDVYNGSTKVNSARRINYVNRVDKTIKVEGRIEDVSEGNIITLQGAYNSELYGLAYCYATSTEQTNYYGNLRSALANMMPTTVPTTLIDGDFIQEVIDSVDERCGADTNLIMTSHKLRREYLNVLRDHCLNVDIMHLDGGYKSLCYNGIPVYADRFVPDETMYFVNTDDFRLGQLADWTWLEGSDGKILRQLDNKAAYGATLVKYANLICKRPIAQARVLYEG